MKLKTHFLAFALFLAEISIPAGISAANLFSTGFDGRWSSTATWTNGTTGAVPSSSDDVTVFGSHVVTVNVTTASARSLKVRGSSVLRFSTTTASALSVINGELEVYEDGDLLMGTPANPIPAGVAAILSLNAGRSLYLSGGGTLTTYGAAKNPVALAQSDVLSGATNLQVPDAGAMGWVVGDTITISHASVLSSAPSTFVNRTEVRTITSLSSSGGFTTVGWTLPLAHTHQAAAGVRVANLTRNVLIQPIGSPSSGPTVFVEGGSFSASHTEFSRINSVAFGEDGTGIVSSCTFTSAADVGVYSNATGAVVRSSVFYNARNLAIREQGRNNVFEDNEVISGRGAGLYVHSSGVGNVLRRNRIYSSNWTGMEIWGSNTVLDSNVTSYNQGGGLDVSNFDNLIVNHVSLGNMEGGLAALTDRTVISGVYSAYNGKNGLDLLGEDVWVSSAHLHGNRLLGLSNNEMERGILGKLRIYLNQSVGLWLSGGSITVHDSVLGYDLAGASAVNGGSEFESWNNGHNQHATFKSVRINPINGTTFQGYDASFLSYNQDFSTGTARLQGDRVLADDFVLDHAHPGWPAAATAPRLIRGAGHDLQVVSVSEANAETQVVLVRCLDGGANQWIVEGAAGVLFGPFTGALSGQDVAGQFTLTFTPGPSPETEDRVAFMLTSSTKDGARQKRFIFADAENTNDTGHSSLVVAPGASFTLKGAAGTPALMETTSGSSPAYFFISSGSVVLENASVRRTRGDGLRFTGSDGVSLSSVTFDDIASAGAYVNLNGLASNATFYNVTFDGGAADPLALFGVQVAGDDSALRWYFATYGGRRSGDTRDSDPNQKVLWADTLAPSNLSGLTAASGANTGEISLSWTAPSDRENLDPNATTSTLRGGSFRIFRSTVQTQRDAAAPAQAQIILTTTAAPGSLQARVEGTLTLGSAYYYRLWAADEFGNASAAVDAGTVPARVKPFAPPNFAASQAGADISLSWAAPINPPDFYRGSYLLEFSTASPAGPWGAPIVISASSTTYLHQGLLQETTYYYQLYATDTGGGSSGTSLPALAQVRTQDVSAPVVTASVGARTVGVAWSQAPLLTFSKAMNPLTIPGAVSLRRMVDNLGQPVPAPSQNVAVQISSNGAGTAFTVAPNAVLEKNNVYELTVATTAADAGGKALAAPSTLRFVTLMDHTVRNVVTEGAQGAVIDVPPMALPADGYLSGAPAAPGPAAAATQKAAGHARDPYRVLISSALVDLLSYDAFGAAQSSFASFVTVSLPYPDQNNDGVLDIAGTAVLAKTLKVHWLDEAHNLWVPLPSTVDMVNHRVSAQTSHFTTFALLSQADLDLTAAFAFPSPFRPAAGDTDITFSGVGQAATVTVMTVDGEVVWEGASSPATLGQIVWNGRNADGSPVATGVYLYRVTNASSSKTGKLAVIR